MCRIKVETKRSTYYPLSERMTRDIRLQGHLKEGIWKVVLEPEGRKHPASKSSRFVPVTGRDFSRSRQGSVSCEQRWYREQSPFADKCQ